MLLPQPTWVLSPVHFSCILPAYFSYCLLFVAQRALIWIQKLSLDLLIAWAKNNWGISDTRPSVIDHLIWIEITMSQA